MTRAVAVRGCGVVTPLGVGADALLDGLMAGRCALGDRDDIVAGLSVRVAAVDDALLDADVLAEDRALALTAAAVDDLLADSAVAATLATLDSTRLGVVVGSTQGSVTRWTRERASSREDPAFVPSPPDTAAPLRHVAERLGARGPAANPSMACASGTAALALGARWLLRGRCDAVVVGGVDSLSAFVRQGFFALRALDPETPRPFDKSRAGLGLGEGAALLLLVRSEQHEPRLLGWGMAGDANHLTGPDREGHGVTRAVTRALDEAQVAPQDIAFICAHGTATSYNDRMEALGLQRALPGCRPPLMSLKGAVGHSLAAAGAVEAVATLGALGRGSAPPTVGLRQIDPQIAADVVLDVPRALRGRIGLSTSSGFGGINAAVVLQAP